MASIALLLGMCLVSPIQIQVMFLRSSQLSPETSTRSMDSGWSIVAIEIQNYVLNMTMGPVLIRHGGTLGLQMPSGDQTAQKTILQNFSSASTLLYTAMLGSPLFPIHFVQFSWPYFPYQSIVLEHKEPRWSWDATSGIWGARWCYYVPSLHLWVCPTLRKTPFIYNSRTCHHHMNLGNTMGPFQMRVILLTEPITKMAMLMLPQQTLIPMRHLFFSLSLSFIYFSWCHTSFEIQWGRITLSIPSTWAGEH